MTRLDRRTEMDGMNLAEKLKAAKQRNPDAYTIIAATSGIPEVRVKQIADGAAATLYEFNTLEVLS